MSQREEMKNKIKGLLEQTFILTTWRSEERSLLSSNQSLVIISSLLTGLRYALCLIFADQAVYHAFGEPSWILGPMGQLLAFGSCCTFATPFLVIVPLYLYQRKQHIDFAGYLALTVDIKRMSKLVARLTFLTKYASTYGSLAIILFFDLLSVMTFKVHRSYLLLINYLVMSTLTGLYSYLYLKFSIGMMNLALVSALSLRHRFNSIQAMLENGDACAAEQAGILFKHISDLNNIVKWIIGCINFIWVPAIVTGLKMVFNIEWYLQIIILVTALMVMVASTTAVACVTQVNADAGTLYKQVSSRIAKSRRSHNLAEVMRFTGSLSPKVGFQTCVFDIYTRESFFAFIMNCFVYYLMVIQLTS